ncbi:MAG: ABC transporter permease [Chloroflexota bacterium]
MNARRLRAIFRRVVSEFRRDHRSIALLFVAPILMTGLIAFIVREGQALSVTVVLVDGSSPIGPVVSGGLRSALEAEDITVVAAADEPAARAAITDGDADVGIVLPDDLGQPGAAITAITNGMDPIGEATQLGIVSAILVETATAALDAPLPSVEHVTAYGVPTDDPIAPYAPAIVGFLAYFFVYILTGISFLRERTGGTLERLMATPVTRGEIVTGYTLGFTLFAGLQVALLMIWSLGTIRVPSIGPVPEFAIGLGVATAGNPAIAFLVVLLLAVGAVSLGIFLSTFARTELQVVQFIPLVIVPQFLLSGILFPISGLPEVLQPLVGLMPVSYAVDGLRQVFIAGADLTSAALQLDLVVLAAIAVFFGLIASLTIRRDVA